MFIVGNGKLGREMKSKWELELTNQDGVASAD
jgi:hypothetical protein